MMRYNTLCALFLMEMPIKLLEVIQWKTRMPDLMNRVSKQKFECVRHVARMPNN